MTSPSSAFASDTHISYSEQLRAEAEAAHHAENRVRAVRVVAGLARDTDECRELLSILGLGTADVGKALDEVRINAAASKPRRKRTAA